MIAAEACCIVILVLLTSTVTAQCLMPSDPDLDENARSCAPLRAAAELPLYLQQHLTSWERAMESDSSDSPLRRDKPFESLFATS